MKFSIKDSFSKCDQIRSLLRIWLHLLKKSLMENFIFYAVILKYFPRSFLSFLIPINKVFFICYQRIFRETLFKTSDKFSVTGFAIVLFRILT